MKSPLLILLLLCMECFSFDVPHDECFDDFVAVTKKKAELYETRKIPVCITELQVGDGLVGGNWDDAAHSDQKMGFLRKRFANASIEENKEIMACELVSRHLAMEELKIRKECEKNVNDAFNAGLKKIGGIVQEPPKRRFFYPLPPAKNNKSRYDSC